MEGFHRLARGAARGIRSLVRAAAAALVGPGRREIARWREAARSVGLAGVEESGGVVAGWSGPLRVRLMHHADATFRGTRVTVSGPGMPAGLTIRPEGLATAVRGLRGVREVETGHDVFDARAWIEGDATLARAVLDAETRRTVGALLEGRLERPGRAPLFVSGAVEGGVLVVDVGLVAPLDSPRDDELVRAAAREALGDPVGRIKAVLAGALALARRLAPPADPARRLADNLKTEPVAGVRRQCLLTLAREFPGHEAARGALLAALRDPDARIRLQAGIALGTEGRETLLAVARGEGADDETTERAVAALGWHLTTAHALDILRHALRARREATARACLRALGRRRGPEGLAALARVLAIETPGLAATAAEALGETADAAAEGPLLDGLGSPHEAVRVAAARGLGRVGTTAAVARLREAEGSDRPLRAVARQAIAEIQSRAKGALPGQLSLAESETGALSIAAEEPGRLSLAEGTGPAEAPAPPPPPRVRE